MKPKRTYTAEDLMRMLRVRYQSDEFAILEQVADQPGAHSFQYIDAVVVTMWPSKGLCRRAFEIKTHRGDLLRELRDPKKNSTHRRDNHEFWYVTPKDIVVADELPVGCGWMHPRGNVLVAAKEAQRNDATPITEHILASLVRSAIKEGDRRAATSEKDILAKSMAHRNALAHEEAFDYFLRDGHGGKPSDHAQGLLDMLKHRTGEKKFDARIKEINDSLEDFKANIARMLFEFCRIADISIRETDSLDSEDWRDSDDGKRLFGASMVDQARAHLKQIFGDGNGSS